MTKLATMKIAEKESDKWLNFFGGHCGGAHRAGLVLKKRPKMANLETMKISRKEELKSETF